MHLCESKVYCNPRLPPSFSSKFQFLFSLQHSHHPSHTCCYLLSFPSLTPSSLSFLPFFISLPLLSSPLLLYPCMSVCVLWAASQDDGEVRAALGTGSQWRGLRPRDAFATISQGSPVIARPDGLQVTPGKRIVDRQMYLNLFIEHKETYLPKKVTER